MSEPVVTRNDSASRYELHLDNELVGFASFFDDVDLGIREFPSTEVDPSYQGRGLAGRLVGEALKDTAAAGLKVSAVCPYVAGFIQRHPEYQSMLA